MRALTLACLVAGCASTAPTPRTPPLSLVASSSGGNATWIMGTRAPKLGAAAPPPGRRTIWVATTACLEPGDAGAHAPPFDPRRCMGIVERVAVDGEISDADATRVEKLSIESAALKLETLLPATDSGEDSGD